MYKDGSVVKIWKVMKRRLAHKNKDDTVFSSPDPGYLDQDRLRDSQSAIHHRDKGVR
jgi:hypothetical protein